MAGPHNWPSLLNLKEGALKKGQAFSGEAFWFELCPPPPPLKRLRKVVRSIHLVLLVVPPIDAPMIAKTWVADGCDASLSQGAQGAC